MKLRALRVRIRFWMYVAVLFEGTRIGDWAFQNQTTALTAYFEETAND